MGMVITALSAISTFHPEGNPAVEWKNIYLEKKKRNKHIYRLLGQMPTISAMAYRTKIGREYNLPKKNYDYVENFLYMLDRLNETTYIPHQKIVRILEVLFILHAEHEVNCSTAALRHLTSAGADVFTSVSGAAGALYGHKHGGANEAVLRMLETIGRKENVPKFIEDVKNKKTLLFGFGHRIYKYYDPRANIVKKLISDVFDIVGKEPIIEIALELEQHALKDAYFI
jgi:citrate synthase